MTPVQQAEDVIAKYQLMLYSVPYCVEVMSGLLAHIKILEAGSASINKRLRNMETQLGLHRDASNVEPM
jgi:hypothetical protein